MARKRGLGRGLDALLSGDAAASVGSGAGAGELQELALDELSPGRYQPRKQMDDEALESLAQSIRTQGVVQPLVVRPAAARSAEKYEIIAGERRWRAARLAGLEVVPAVVRDVPDTIAMAVALIENIQREDLNPLEEANALKRLIHECKMTHQQCAEAVGRSRASVSNLLRLTELDGEIQQLLLNGALGMGHARALLGATDLLRVDLARKVVARGLSVRQTESLVKAALSGGSKAKASPEKSPRMESIERDLTASLGVSVAVKPSRRGGKLEIRYRDAKQLDALVNRFGKDA